jgi:hypothetical protein
MPRLPLAALALLAFCLPGPAETADLIPHHAFYTLTLSAKRSSSGIVEASGGMAIEMNESCDAWITKQRLRLRILHDEGDEVVTDDSFTSWESKDGLHYRFSVRNKLSGEANEELRGEAEIRPRGGAGVANFTQPDHKKVVLPKGVLLPTGHVGALIDAARAGSQIFHRVVFDGSTLDGPDEINVVIGRPVPLEKLPGLDKMIGKPSWPTRWAFFPIGSSNALPDYEVSMRLLEDGVVADISLVYEDFEVHGAIEYFEPLPRPKC